ncbi:adenine phosphoribosyltransferase [Puniceibacterium sp. IMCC21224]|nr:adenine phosphoribosyltransferase [Puniceibacterium sp. IMCC21224]
MQPPRKEVRDYIRTIVDFPHEGILFRDVTTLFADPRGFRMAIDQLLTPYAGLRFDKVVGLEARGFILGGAVAHQLSVGFVPIRKKGKLPGAVISEEYTLEYGAAVVEIHDDAILPGERVLLVDDLLATGGTAKAGIQLVERLGGVIIGCAFIVDLPDLGGRKRLEDMGMEVHALCAFDGQQSLAQRHPNADIACLSARARGLHRASRLRPRRATVQARLLHRRGSRRDWRL